MLEFLARREPTYQQFIDSCPLHVFKRHIQCLLERRDLVALLRIEQNEFFVRSGLQAHVQFSEKTSIATGVRKATSKIFRSKKGAERLGNTVRKFEFLVLYKFSLKISRSTPITSPMWGCFSFLKYPLPA